MRALLDVNVLIALLDVDHTLHAKGCFVTFDTSVALDAVKGARKNHLLTL